ncbi:hypothetical protein KSP40_PGU009447 [Platanthera guangdongensis]|uniref:Tetratricopeptide repeat protein n=1 Tax=Platanthera guangdongensis TaxID=2320717 RepID=A0ABR2MZK0_9ASPA
MGVEKGACYVRENKLEKGITQFEAAVMLQPGYITAWNNLGDAYEKKKDVRSALKAFEETDERPPLLTLPDADGLTPEVPDRERAARKSHPRGALLRERA